MTIKERLIKQIRHFTRSNYLGFTNYLEFYTRRIDPSPMSFAFVTRDKAIVDTKVGFVYFPLEKLSTTNLNIILNNIEAGKFDDILSGDFNIGDYNWW